MKHETKTIFTVSTRPCEKPLQIRDVPTLSETRNFQSRELAVTGSFFFCEACNSVCEYGDQVWHEHSKELKSHKIKRMLLLPCANCGNVVVDTHAEYSPEKNQFWCRNCIGTVGYLKFRSFA